MFTLSVHYVPLPNEPNFSQAIPLQTISYPPRRKIKENWNIFIEEYNQRTWNRDSYMCNLSVLTKNSPSKGMLWNPTPPGDGRKHFAVTISPGVWRFCFLGDEGWESTCSKELITFADATALQELFFWKVEEYHKITHQTICILFEIPQWWATAVPGACWSKASGWLISKLPTSSGGRT